MLCQVKFCSTIAMHDAVNSMCSEFMVSDANPLMAWLAPLWPSSLNRTDACAPRLSQAHSGFKFKRGRDRAAGWCLWEPNPMSYCCLSPLTLSLKTWRQVAILHLTIIVHPLLWHHTCPCIVRKTHTRSLTGVEKAPDSDSLYAHRVRFCCILAD